MTVVRVNWCRTCGHGGNFGDMLGPRLLLRAGIIAEWAMPDQAQLVTVGSVLSKFKPGWRGTVWGTGLIKETTRSFTRARIISVRGELTRDRAGLPKSTPLGDPGVLVVDLLPGPVTTHPLSLIVPHYVDHDMIHRHLGRRVADIAGDPDKLLDDIASSNLVFTSSLHALIAADALGVPHVYEPHPAVTGGAWKFNDYLSALGEPGIKPGVERLTPRRTMLAKQREVRAQLMKLGKLWT
jgi:hypothetical protein